MPNKINENDEALNGLVSIEPGYPITRDDFKIDLNNNKNTRLFCMTSA